MFVKRLGADMKLHRARQMLSELAHLQDQHLATAIRLEATPAPAGGEQWRVRIARDVSPAFAALVGKAIHTTRSALDDLAVSLVSGSGRTPRNTTFPIALTAHDYAEEESICLRRATPAARDAVRSVTPWRGANDKLWELHQLDTAGTRPPVLHLGQAVPREPVHVPSALRPLQRSSQGAGARYPLTDNSALHLQAARGPRTDPARWLGATIHLVLDEGELVRGQPVIKSLEMLITHTSGVIDDVVAAAEHH